MAYLDKSLVANAVANLFSPVWLACMRIRDAHEEPTSRLLSVRLLTAIEYNVTAAAKYALRKGANPNTKFCTGNYALYETAKIGHKGYVTLLLDAGADIDKKGDSKLTPLMVATMEGQSSTVRLLLERNADPLKVSFYGKTARDLATYNDYSDIAAILEAAEAKMPPPAAPAPFSALRIRASSAPVTTAASATPAFNPAATGQTITVSAPLTLKKTPGNTANTPSSII